MAYKNFKATEIIEEIGAELRKIRTDNNQTISHVAIKLAEKGFQISNTLLGRIENGERRIDDDTLNAICNYYKVDPSSVIIAASKEHIRRYLDPSSVELVNLSACLTTLLYQNGLRQNSCMLSIII